MKYFLSIVGFIVICSSYVFAADSWTNPTTLSGSYSSLIICTPGTECQALGSGIFGDFFTGYHNLELLANPTEETRTITFFVNAVNKRVNIDYTVTVQNDYSDDAELWYKIKHFFDEEPMPGTWSSVINNGVGIGGGGYLTTTNSNNHKLDADATDDCNHDFYVLVRATAVEKQTEGSSRWTITFTFTATVI